MLRDYEGKDGMEIIWNKLLNNLCPKFFQEIKKTTCGRGDFDSIIDLISIR